MWFRPIKRQREPQSCTVYIYFFISAIRITRYSVLASRSSLCPVHIASLSLLGATWKFISAQHSESHLDIMKFKSNQNRFTYTTLLFITEQALLSSSYLKVFKIYTDNKTGLFSTLNGHATNQISSKYLLSPIRYIVHKKART